MCVSYCSTMILELNGMPNLGHFIYNARHYKFDIKRPCGGLKKEYKSYNILSYYLDPGHRNRQFCMYIDDVCKHNCYNCKGGDLEIFEPYRLTNYHQFQKKAKEIIKW